jgi:hypothetical protein
VTDIAAEVRDILVLHLGTNETMITPSVRLVEDLGVDSVDLFEVVVNLAVAWTSPCTLKLFQSGDRRHRSPRFALPSAMLVNQQRSAVASSGG